MDSSGPEDRIDFDNTEIAFRHKTDKELKKAKRLFSLMNKQSLVTLGSNLGLLALKLRLPFVQTIIKNTVFEHFCGGVNLLDCQKSIDDLNRFKTLTILDYGAESKSEEEDLDHVCEETIRAIELGASNSSVPVISSKLTGLVDNDILIKLQKKESLSTSEQRDYDKLKERLNKIGQRAHDLKVGVFIDAEESWMQDPIDALVEEMMLAYNKEHATIYNTYQMYRWDKLDQLKEDYEKSQKGGYILGAKLVRGAYMDKERAHAESEGYKSPICDDKAATDKSFNDGIRFCMDHWEGIASCCASHNLESSLLQAKLIKDKGLDKNHPHLNFCQLYGMSDFISFNLANAGYNVAKYVPYGPIREVVPYLIRRAKENASVTGEMSRELDLISREVKRRGI